ncbi:MULTISPECIES: MarR family winged helix-turn-helix transcriptional regulator [unclassified Caloramator]|uniref:MarR family winged helix-turn-helix transcriptional regulator n=1 Tax=unclassified Caloramator TaxID=2629145 RepID=UPI00237E78E6|nr:MULTISPECIES: MarR family transcriptional regulator [unclassified Caloramator]MDO6354719.1 MarR family transcriptional regulator [Caloramator sp. CAR-1]WDU83453.1 MarR family transcriptional regulator [Caloramator sp. Dgby_cultured_2]
MSRERLAEYLQTFLPMFYKKLMKGITLPGVTKQQLWLLYLIENHDEKPMSFYSEKMMIPKSNLTSIADKLIEDGLIERAYDPKDRRIILLKITDKGKLFINDCREKTKKAIFQKLENLDDKDVDRLNEIFEEMKNIFKKLEQ